MALTTMGELATCGYPPEDADAFRAVVEIIDKSFPNDWRSWAVYNYSYTELFGEEASNLDRIRLAIPTAELGKAFGPESSSLSERRYRSVRAKILKWPLGRALIYGPHHIMEKIHGSGRSYLSFMDAVQAIRIKLTSRKEASSELRGSSTGSTPRQTRKRHSLERYTPDSPDKAEDAPQPKRSRAEKEETGGTTDQLLASFLNQQMQLFNKMMSNQEEQNNKIEKLITAVSFTTQRNNSPLMENTSRLDESFESVPDSSCWEEEESPQPTPPRPLSPNISREEDLRNKIAEAQRELAALQSSSEKTIYDFTPNTKESDPKIATAEPLLLEQGIQCQRFGQPGWRNVRYGDTQRLFQATPAFCALKVNGLLASVTPPYKYASLLEKVDLTLGAITNGLLQQRKILKELFDELPQKFKDKVGSTFWTADSKYKKNSEDLLQYVCGRRAEIIEARRNIYRAKNKALSQILRTIPPSESHLFADNALSQAIKDCANTDVIKLFPASANKKKLFPGRVGKGKGSRTRVPQSTQGGFHRKPATLPSRSATKQQQSYKQGQQHQYKPKRQ